MLSLFDAENILPQDGELLYYPSFFNPTESGQYFNYLLQHIPWQHDELVMFGKKITTKRKVAWYANDNLSYKYSGKIKIGLLWNETLLQIKNHIEKITQHSFNSCLLNLYHNGTEAMGWHADNEPELQPHGTIASVSFGASRYMAFKHNNQPLKLKIMLQHGSLLLMKNEIQQHWKHALLASKAVTEPRINLTFRTIKN